MIVGTGTGVAGVATGGAPLGMQGINIFAAALNLRR